MFDLFSRIVIRNEGVEMKTKFIGKNGIFLSKKERLKKRLLFCGLIVFYYIVAMDLE